MDYFYNYYLGGSYVGALIIAMKGSNFWFTATICVIILMLPVLTSRFYAVDVDPNLVDKIRLKRKLQKKSKSSEDTSRTPSAKRPRRSLRSGYAFAHHVSVYSFKLEKMTILSSHELNHQLKFIRFILMKQEGFGRLITSGKIMRKLPQDFAFPLGLGTKRYQQQNGDGPLPNSVNYHINTGDDSNQQTPEKQRKSEIDSFKL